MFESIFELPIYYMSILSEEDEEIPAKCKKYIDTNYGDLLQHMGDRFLVYDDFGELCIKKGFDPDILNYSDTRYIWLAIQFGKKRPAYVVAKDIATARKLVKYLESIKNEEPFTLCGFYSDYPMITPSCKVPLTS